MFRTCFSQDYFEARDRFRAAAVKAGSGLLSLPLTVEECPDLTIDVASLGPEAPDSAVVVTSGCHGVEGFFGSAIQLAWLERFHSQPHEIRSRIIFIHAINPYGFARLRRVNEDNVDLNRNFLASDETYTGFPPAYDELNGFLNPPTPPSWREPFRLKAVWNIARRGMPALKAAIAGGQYAYPRGLFFGGHGPCQSTRLVQQGLTEWIGSARRVVHLDFHTGLGRFGTFKLLLEATEESETGRWFKGNFVESSVQPLSKKKGIAYPARGVMGSWLQKHFADRDYRFATAEFGTYGVLRVLAALRRENQAHSYSPHDSPAYLRAKAELLECFTPRDPAWRERVVATGLDLIAKCEERI